MLDYARLDYARLTMQDALLALTRYWTDRGAMVVQPLHQDHMDLLDVLHNEINDLAGSRWAEVPPAHGAVRV